MLYDLSAVFVGFCLFNASMSSNTIELKGFLRVSTLRQHLIQKRSLPLVSIDFQISFGVCSKSSNIRASFSATSHRKMCLQAFAQTPMLSLINWRKKNGSEWSRLKHSVLFGESGRVSILLFRNYPTICFTTSGNVEGFFRLLPPRSRMSEKSFL